MSRNNDCTNANIPQQIIFSGKLEEDDGPTMFYIAEKQQKAILNFFFKFINCNRIIQIMEHQKILNLLNEASDSKSVTRKCNIVNHQWNANYDIGNKVVYNTEVLKTYLCNYNVVKDDITIKRHQVTRVTFKNCAPLAKCITKIDRTAIDDAKFRFSHANVQANRI